MTTKASSAQSEARAHRLRAASLREEGRIAEAEAAEDEAIALAAHDPLIAEAGRALAAGQLAVAERLLRARLAEAPDDVPALLLLAEIALALGIAAEAEALIGKALALAPAYAEARLRLATVLAQQNRPLDAIAALDSVPARGPARIEALLAKSAILGQIGRYDEARALLEAERADFAGEPRLWLAYGNLLKTIGRGADSIAAYRRALEGDPGSGEAYWSLANVKSGVLDEADVAAIEAALADSPSPARALHLHFALGQALEDRGDYRRAFAHYAEGNRLRRAQLPYDPAENAEQVRRQIALFTPDFLGRRAGSGDGARDPIFILGLPRSGSTLIEQILASHSEVEGTAELPVVPMLIQGLLAERWRDPGARYPDILAALDPERLAELGRRYLDSARLYRKTGRPLFIDKLPNNWLNIGFIHLILPNARIVDARRHPLACGFSNFKQHFAQGQAFAYDLADIGHHYRDYLALTGHYDRVLPGRIVRVVHEELVDDPEAGIRRLLELLDLRFDPACLRFHENERAVRTASAAQVRRPISRSGLDQWRNFEPWLGPLEAALGPAVASYPDAPESPSP